MQKKVESSQNESLQLKSQFESAVNLKERKLHDREAQLANVNHQVFEIYIVLYVFPFSVHTFDLLQVSQLEEELSSVKIQLSRETQHSGDLSNQLNSCQKEVEQLQMKVSSLEEERNVLTSKEAELK